MAGFMLAKVSECMREPLLMAAATDIASAVKQLKESHADSLLVETQDILGMVTKTDLLNALVLKGSAVTSAVDEIAHFNLVTVAPDQYLFEVLVLMTRHKVSRVVVMEQNALKAL